ncbi:hypothetical protein BA177_16125 [Woeseia oceani]|uniref:Uncharacterized protein n=1 Tax=Woeseia oceani TaxID=1548547 RepID=A0A193LJ20_9GAMM|nr:hypothetical protein BA177_16125 [Woeseia oceani]
MRDWSELANAIEGELIMVSALRDKKEPIVGIAWSQIQEGYLINPKRPCRKYRAVPARLSGWPMLALNAETG